MPAIKKKWIKASQDGAELPEDENEDGAGDEDRELGDTGGGGEPARKAKKRPAQSSPQAGLLKGLDGEVLLEKRKRFVPPAELKLSEWLDNNLEKRTEETLHLPHLYKYYTELCQGDASDILDVPEFNRMVKEKFGKTFGLQQSSVYKSLIKERKINQEKKKGTGIKLKEIVHEAINHFGNPWNGVRFFNLKQYIGTKYPAIQIDLRPKLLKRALEMGLQYGKIELVKGIGMAGFYKLPGGEPPPPKEKAKGKKEEEGEKEEGEKESEDKQVSGDAKADTKAEGSAEDGEKKEESGVKKKKRKKKAKKDYSKVHHGSPSRIEDVLPLAITYQSAPKAVSIPKIRRYIQDKYGEVFSDKVWRKAVETGADKGYWEHVSGSGMAGTLHLLMDDFDPASDQHEDMICAAIIACHEPKAASANQIKKYISQYHQEFQVDARPIMFKKALLRALAKNVIVRVSGIGASGSFQLAHPFTPSPSVLAGEDESSEEEAYDSNEPVYVPRGTKSRGMPKVKTMEYFSSSSSKAGKGKGHKKSSGKAGRKRRVNSYAESSSEEEEEPTPRRKSKNTPSKKKGKDKAGKGKPVSKKQAHPPSSSEVEEAEDEPEYTPRKSQSRGGPPPKSEKPAKQVAKMAAKPSKKSPKPTKPVAKTETPVSTPAKKTQKESAPSSGKKAKGTPTPSKSPSRSSNRTDSAKKHKLVDSDEADEESGPEEEYTPRKSKSRGGGGEEAKSAQKGKISRFRM